MTPEQAVQSDAVREALETLWDEAFSFAEGKRHDGTPWAAHHDRTRTIAVETALGALAATPPAPVEGVETIRDHVVDEELCIGCNKPILAGQVLTVWDDEVGHADCDAPFSLDVKHPADADWPPPVVLLGEPARYFPLASLRATASPAERVSPLDALLREARVVVSEWVTLGKREGYQVDNATDLLARIDAALTAYPSIEDETCG